MLTKGELKKRVIVDATVIESSRRPIKTFETVVSKDKAKKEEVVISYSDENEAIWLKKGGKFFYGYKLHMGLAREVILYWKVILLSLTTVTPKGLKVF